MEAHTEVPKPTNFKDFMEKSGVGDQIIRLLLDLFEKPEKAEDVSKFVSARFGCDTETSVEQLIFDINHFKDENIRLQKEVEELQKELETVKPAEYS